MLPPGTRLGPYELLSPLGAGGMGEVYRARDTRLDRTVAVKVLPSHLAQDPDRLARFEREARAVSALSHPNICALFDVGAEAGIHFLVLELIEGETLADRLQKGPLPQEQALPIGVQVADALDKAHRAGIVHRDLKPGNVMLTKTGAKLLDFGLARIAEPIGITGGGVSTLPTRAKPLTEAGSLLGTFQYMAPEQLEGKDADARTDIFALGSVLYEMLTGKRAFDGKSQASLIAAILEKEPEPIATLQPLTPPALERLVRKSLAKDPDERWQSAGDLADELKWLDHEPHALHTTPTATRARPYALLAVAAGCLLLGALAANLLTRHAPRSHEGAGVAQRLSVNLPPGTSVGRSTSTGSLAISLDGRHIAFAGVSSGLPQLYLRSLGDLEARPVPGTQGADTPFFSSDGQWLGFFAENKLKKVSVGGGLPVVICDAPYARGASWSEDGTILLVPETFSGLSRVRAEGGTPEVVTKADPKTAVGGHRWPQVLPGGKAALFSTVRSWHDEGRDVAAVVLATGEWKVLVKGASYPRYLEGILFYARGGSILAATFDAGRLMITGPEVTVLKDVRMYPRDSGYAFFDIASTGTATFVPGYGRAVERTLVWLDRKGQIRPLAAEPRPYVAPVISPDGSRIAVAIEGPNNDDIWVRDLVRDSWTRLTFDGDNRFPVWSPDGSRVAFQSLRDGVPNVYWAPAEGGGDAVPLTQEQSWYGLPRTFSPDGKEIALTAFVAGVTGQDVWTVGTAAGSRPKPMITTPATESAGAFSPDGKWFAYVSDESGKVEIYVRSYPEAGKRWPISSGGGNWVRWPRSGREIAYRNENKVMAVTVSTTHGFEAGTPHLLFELSSVTGLGGDSTWNDVTPDGERFLVVKGPEGPGPQIVVAPGFLDEVRARLRAAGAAAKGTE